MNCPECGGKLRVIDSRSAANNTTRRSLKCPGCEKMFYSVETLTNNNIEKIKSAGMINMSSIFSKLAKNAIVYSGYTSSLTGGTYPTKEEAEKDTIAELERIYNER